MLSKEEQLEAVKEELEWRQCVIADLRSLSEKIRGLQLRLILVWALLVMLVLDYIFQGKSC
jgi:hypothetical protein